MDRVTGQDDLFPKASEPEGLVVINGRCLLRTADGHRVVVVAGVVLAQYAVGDRMGEAYAMVSLVEQGWAEQEAVALAFGVATRTVRRFQRRFEEGGLAALGRKGGYPKGRQRVGASRVRLVNRLKAQGLSNRAIAHGIGVTEKAVRKLVRRLGWCEPAVVQASLGLQTGAPEVPEPGVPPADLNLSAIGDAAPVMERPEQRGGISESSGHADLNLSASEGALQSISESQAPEEAPLPTPQDVPVSLDVNPADRRYDRLLAYLGLLDDAAPLFRSGCRIPAAGVLLAVPALVESGVVEIAREVYGSIGPAFYGLRTTIVALLLMALLRIKRPEALKEHPADELGRVLGLDRAPEVKTLRRKLARLASFGRATELGRALAKRRVASRGAALGFLYVDGHVRAYHGKHVIPKAHVARMRISMPATTDYWVGDVEGDPLFLVTAQANAGMVEMLPKVLAEAKTVVGPRRITVVFDRGGWSPQLFQQLLRNDFDILTYRKSPFPRVPRRLFRQYEKVVDGKTSVYTLADQRVRLRVPGGRLSLRQVTRLAEDGRHQTPIVTSRNDLTPLKVALRMFDRWKQENFFKYLRDEYALDALVEYAVESDDPVRLVPNPARKAIDTELREARTSLTDLQSQFGMEALANPEKTRRTMRGFKIAHGKLGRTLRVAMKRVTTLETRRAKMPTHVPIGDIIPAGDVVKLAPERQHLASLMKMVAYQAESDLVRLLAPYYKRADDEGRTLIQSALASCADLEVTETELRVRLAPLSSPHRTAAIAALCQDLNDLPTIFPGTRLKLRFFAEATPSPDSFG